MKSYFAYLGRGCYNYMEERTDGGIVDIIQKGQRYYFASQASSMNALVKGHQIRELEIYDKIVKILNIHFVSFTSILKSNIISNGDHLVEIYFGNSSILVAKDIHIATTRNMVCIKSNTGRFVSMGNESISDETFQRLLTLTENTLNQIDDIWMTI